MTGREEEAIGMLDQAEGAIVECQHQLHASTLFSSNLLLSKIRLMKIGLEIKNKARTYNIDS